jgi:hypothetical protein
MKVIDAAAKFEVKTRYPKWFLETIDANCWYHEDAEKDFELIRNDDRFALGLAWFCRKCGVEVLCREDWADQFKVFVVIKLTCPKCKNIFLHEGADPSIRKYILEHYGVPVE